MSSNAILQCRSLCKTFEEGPEPVHVLKGINFEIQAGDLAAIVGNSGSGKTTLLHLMGGLDLPSSGDVIVSGKNLAKMNEAERGLLRNQHLGFVYQFHHLLPEFTALENVAMPLLLRKGYSVKQAQLEADQYLAQVGLSHRVKHKPSALSGGERQRVAIARALVTQPDCVLADEPTGNLDVHTAREIQDLMLKLNEELKTTFLIVTHDLSLAGKVNKVFKMEDGSLEEGVL